MSSASSGRQVVCYEKIHSGRQAVHPGLIEAMYTGPTVYQPPREAMYSASTVYQPPREALNVSRNDLILGKVTYIVITVYPTQPLQPYNGSNDSVLSTSRCPLGPYSSLKKNFSFLLCFTPLKLNFFFFSMLNFPSKMRLAGMCFSCAACLCGIENYSHITMNIRRGQHPLVKIELNKLELL